MPKPSVIVIGAGPGGIAATRRLLASGQVGVTLVQREGNAQFLPGILPVLSGVRPPDGYRHTVALEGAQTRAGEVVALEAGHVWLADGASLAADAIIVATGLVTDTASVPVGPHTFPVWEIEQAAAARSAVERLASGRLVVAITSLPYRCPPAPYGLAMTLASQFRELGRPVEVIVTTPEQRPLLNLGERVSSFMEQLARAAGIELRTGARLDPAASRDGLLVTEDGERLAYDLALFIPPHRRPDFLSAVAGTGPLVQVDERLRASLAGVWAIGDVAASALPRAAGVAEAQGRTAAGDALASLGLGAPQPVELPAPSCFVWTSHTSAARIQIAFPDGLPPTGTPAISLDPPSAELSAEALDARTRWLSQVSSGSR